MNILSTGGNVTPEILSHNITTKARNKSQMRSPMGINNSYY